MASDYQPPYSWLRIRQKTHKNRIKNRSNPPQKMRHGFGRCFLMAGRGLNAAGNRAARAWHCTARQGGAWRTIMQACYRMYTGYKNRSQRVLTALWAVRVFAPAGTVASAPGHRKAPDESGATRWARDYLKRPAALIRTASGRSRINRMYTCDHLQCYCITSGRSCQGLPRHELRQRGLPPRFRCDS